MKRPRRRLYRWLVCTLVATLTSSVAPARAVAPAEFPSCRGGISRETAERLFAVLNHPPAEPDCEFAGIETHRSNLEARWTRAGKPLPSVTVVPRECVSAAPLHSGPFVVKVPDEIGRNCPSVVPLIADFVNQVAGETPAGEVGSENDPLFNAARALFLALALGAAVLLVRGLSRWRSLDARWMVVGLAGFFGALALRAGVPFSLGNWYSEVLPATGPPPWMRFGPGYFAFQSLLRAVGIWSPQTLIMSQLLLGAAALPLLAGVLRELEVGLEAAAAAVVLFVFAPFHVRLSATPSEHVLASTLCLCLLFSWLRATRTGDWLWFCLTLLLFPAVCATRVDMSVQAALVLLWPLLRDRVERRVSLRGSQMPWRFALMGVVAATTLAGAYLFIALPSHHPVTDPAGRFFALRQLVPQYWVLATSDPAWMSLPAVLLAALGLVAMGMRRPLLLLRVAGTLLVAFVVLGRCFVPDELLGARYFLFTIPVFLIAAAHGFEALLGLAPRRQRAAVAAAGIVALGIWAGLAARPAYAVRYAFQDEYTAVRQALAQLPAECAVYAVPMRADVFPHDLDCCLDVRRSPLVLDFPRLRFHDLPDALDAVSGGSGCVAYYESIACRIVDDPQDAAVHDRADKAADYLQKRCAEVRSRGRLDPIVEFTTSPRATVDFFHGRRPNAGLYRWRP